MRRPRTWLAVPVVFALGGGPVRAAHEAAGEHAKHPTHTVVLDVNDIRPETTSMDKGDALVFENHALAPIIVTFTEPADLKNKIRCGLVKPSPTSKAEAPWQLFAWEGSKLRGVIPPGRFASVCSLAEGSYSFTTTRVSTRTVGSGSLLPPKGEIVVK